MISLRVFLHVSFTILLILSTLHNPICAKESEQSNIPLAGKSLFPEKNHKKWQEIQSDSDLIDEEKIKNTIDTFLKLKLDSEFRHVLLDFCFLFDNSDSTSHETYAFERGLLHWHIARSLGVGFSISQFYRHPPEFSGINIHELCRFSEVRTDEDIS